MGHDHGRDEISRLSKRYAATIKASTGFEGEIDQFKDAETLIDDFFDEVERVLYERGVDTTVVEVEDTRGTR